MLKRVPVTIRIGVGLILAAVAWAGACAAWASPANPMWEPLDVPISPSSEHFRASFSIHLESTHRIVVVTGLGEAPRAEWSLFKGKQVVARGHDYSDNAKVDDAGVKWRELGMFQAATGHYVLDVDFVGDRNPLRGARLQVFEIGGWRMDAQEQVSSAILESLLLVLAGIYLIVRETKTRDRERASDLARASSLTQAGPLAREQQIRQSVVSSPTVKTWLPHWVPVGAGIFLVLTLCCAYVYTLRRDVEFASAVLGLCSAAVGGGASALAIAGARRFRKQAVPVAPCEPQGPFPASVRWRVRSSIRRPVQGMPSFGLVASLFFLCVGVPFWLRVKPFPSTGLMVHLLRPAPSAPRVPGMDPLLVQVTSEPGGGNHRVYVNWQPVTWAELSAVLQRELKYRSPNWPVYVEGNPDEDWQWVAKAIDTIRGLHAEVCLLTTWKGLPRERLETRTNHKASGTHPPGVR